jgi:anti-anti-sigma regulatory factor
VRITVQCEPDHDPSLDKAPQVVVVRTCTFEPDDLQQLRRVLHALVTTSQRVVTVDLSEVDDIRRTNVIAVLIGAAREARANGSMLHVLNPPNDGRRALFVAGIDEPATADDTAYEIIVGTPRVPESLAV